jgi:hypothetical protein
MRDKKQDSPNVSRRRIFFVDDEKGLVASTNHLTPFRQRGGLLRTTEKGVITPARGYFRPLHRLPTLSSPPD